MGSFKFLQKGKAAHAAIEKEESAAAARRAQSDQPRRFWIPDGKETQITFLDGALDDDGLLDAVTYWEHQLKINGNWRNWFACTQLDEPCPICDGTDSQPSLVSVFTIIDHTEWKDSNGKVHKDEKRLFVCKRETFRRLQKIAAKKGGLVGVTFDVSRNGDKSPGVGDTFDFVDKRTLKALAKELDLDKDAVTPYDYEEVIEYRSAKELRKLGFGSSKGVPGDADADDEDEDEKPKKGKKSASTYDDEDDEKPGKGKKGKAKKKPKYADEDDDEPEYDDKV